MAVTGLLTPDARLRVFSDLGVVLPGAKLNTYVAGTPSTLLATYSDSALTVPNTNPVVASAGGLFGPIYLTPGVAYKLLLTDSAGVTITGWPQDNVMVPANNTLAAGTGIGLATVAGVTTITATAVGSIAANDFRLTLETGVPVSRTDQTGKTTVFCTPMTGNRIDLYDGAGVPTTLTSAQFSIALPAVANQAYDVFCFNNAGVPTLELLAWTNDTTRATAVVRTTTGAVTKAGDLTRRLLGSVHTGTVAGQAADALTDRSLANVSNRVRRPLLRKETTANWTYTLAAIRQANANAANQVTAMVCLAEVNLFLIARVYVTNAGGASLGIGIGEDSTTTFSTNQIGGAANTTTHDIPMAVLDVMPAVGFHFYSWNESSAAVGTSTWFGGAGSFVAGIQDGGLIGWIEG